MQKIRFFQPAKLRSSWHEALLLLVLLSLVSCGGGGGSQSSSSTDPAATYTVQGTISPALFMEFDSDTNDPDADFRSNDSFDKAQSISSPTTVSGYVNLPGSGSSGRSYLSGDSSDFFRVTLTAGQTIMLSFPDAVIADLDLYLFDSSELQVDASMGTGATETLRVETAGTYYIEVRAYNAGPNISNASSYTLTIDKNNSSPGAEEMHLSDDFVARDIIVRLKDDVSLSTAAVTTAASLAEKAQKLGLQSLAGKPDRAMLMGFKTAAARNQAFSTLGISKSPPTTGVSALSATQISKLDTIRIIKALRRRSDVASADLNYYRYAAATPNDSDYNKQIINYQLINLPEAWNLTTGSDNVIVAVIDTGVLLNHPDLNGRIITGYDFVSDSSRSNDGDGIDDNPNDPGDQSRNDGSSSFHGTHVTGIIAATTNNSTGVAGVTWSGKIMPLRALGLGAVGTSYDILQAVRYAAGLDNDSTLLPAHPADIINMSLGSASNSYSQAEQNLYNQVHASGIIVVAAAGNDGLADVDYPAAYDGVVAVSAVDNNGDLTYYSNYGPTVDVAAPGGAGAHVEAYDIYSTCGNDSGTTLQYTYCYKHGTSMATPHVAGVAALLKSTYPDLTASDFDALLRSGLLTDTDTTSRNDYYGYGLIDADKAVAWAQTNQTVPTALATNPESLNFGAFSDSLTVELYLSGSGSSGTVSIAVDAAWLNVAASAVDSSGIGTYTLSVDRSALSPGTSLATVTFSSDVPDVSPVAVPVTVQKSLSTSLVNGGYFHIGLLDPQTEEIKYETSGTLTNGELRYLLSDVEAGSYILYSATDMDNDGHYNELDEVVGAYPSLQQLSPINVSSDRNDLNFTVQLYQTR